MTGNNVGKYAAKIADAIRPFQDIEKAGDHYFQSDPKFALDIYLRASNPEILLRAARRYTNSNDHESATKLLDRTDALLQPVFIHDGYHFYRKKADLRNDRMRTARDLGEAVSQLREEIASV